MSDDELPYMKALAINKNYHYTVEEMKRHPSYVQEYPQMKMSTMEATVALDKYLVELHCQLWPRGQWTITNPERREDAIDWFIEVAQKIGLIDMPVQPAIMQEQIVPRVTLNGAPLRMIKREGEQWRIKREGEQ